MFNTNQYFSGVKIPDPEDMVSDPFWKEFCMSRLRLPACLSGDHSVDTQSCRLTRFWLLLTGLRTMAHSALKGQLKSEKENWGKLASHTLAFSANVEAADGRA